jgi:glucose-6-phosphate isomerase
MKKWIFTMVVCILSMLSLTVYADMEKATGKDVPFAENIAAKYAAVRNGLYSQAGKKIEIIVNFQPKLHFMAEWWKQLFGESEGKDGKGIFPAACDFTTDLHSMGQWIQEGERSIFETVISIEKANKTLLFPHDDENLDGLNFLEGKHVDEVNKMAELGTRLAHVDGGVPNIRLSVPELNEYYIGQIIFFFEIACGISGNLLEVKGIDIEYGLYPCAYLQNAKKDGTKEHSSSSHKLK